MRESQPRDARWARRCLVSERFMASTRAASAGPNGPGRVAWSTASSFRLASEIPPSIGMWYILSAVCPTGLELLRLNYTRKDAASMQTQAQVGPHSLSNGCAPFCSQSHRALSVDRGILPALGMSAPPPLWGAIDCLCRSSLRQDPMPLPIWPNHPDAVLKASLHSHAG